MSLGNSSVDKGWGKSARRFPPTENEQGSWNKFNDLVRKKDNFPFDLSVYIYIKLAMKLWLTKHAKSSSSASMISLMALCHFNFTQKKGNFPNE